MKNIFILIVLILNSCGFATMDNMSPIIITDINAYDKCYCEYYGKGDYRRIITPVEHKFLFIDNCKKFQIGDTIIFIKK